MAWFSKSSSDFFLATVVPQGQGGAQVAQFLGLVNGEAALNEARSAAKSMGADGIVGIDFDYEVLGETNGMMLVSVTGTAVKMA